MFDLFTVLGLMLLCSLPFALFESKDDSEPDPVDDTTLQGTDGADTLTGTDMTLLIDAGAGDDDITAENETEIDAGAGNDSVDAGGGVTINAGDGDDQITAGGESVIDAGAGDDSVIGQGGSTVSGGDGDDTLLGSGLLSTLDGGAGDDVIDAGPGVLLTTGTGTDTVNLNASYPVTNDIYNSGPVTVTDYVAGQDSFEITGTYTPLEAGGYDVGTLAFVQTAEGVSVTVGGGGVILLRGVTLADVDQGDFVPDSPPAMV
jgi:Ca2+-binding RTX toxin-like protein